MSNKKSVKINPDLFKVAGKKKNETLKNKNKSSNKTGTMIKKDDSTWE